MRTVSAVVLAICSMWFSGQPALAAKRVALVIGNSAYQTIPPLVNPANDAAAMSTMLKGAGFDVVELKRDLKVGEMRRVLRDFSDQARGVDVALAFFSGHGIEIDGTNYLIPVDAVLERDIDAFDEAIPLDRVVAMMEPARQLRIVIVDACRDNPFARTMKHIAATRGLGWGLYRVEPESPNTLIAFAAKAGTTAADGNDELSPFTAALVKYLPRPGLDLRRAFGFVRDDVLKATGNRQEPFVYGSLGGEDVALVPAAPAAPATPAVAVPEGAAPADPSTAARSDYELALQINVASVWESFVSRHPSGFYADLAIAQRDKLKAAEAAANEAARVAAENARLAAEKKSSEQARIAEAERARLAAALGQVGQAAGVAAVSEPGKQAGRITTAALEDARIGQASNNEASRLSPGCTGAPLPAATFASRQARSLSPAEECGLSPKDSFRECEDCPEMVMVPAGEFMMGSNREDVDSGMAAANEEPQHKAVIAQPIAVGRFEVTRDQYAAFVKASGYASGNRCYTFENNKPQERDDRSFLNPGFRQEGDHPVVCVSWVNAKAYVEWLSRTTGKPYRLLSEAEYEYAARAGSASRYGFGNDPAEICKFANGADQSARSGGLPADQSYMDCTDGYPFTAPVGSREANAFGLYDLIGNVWEWTEDCFYGNYATARQDSAARAEAVCTSRTVRGGDWFSTAALLRPAARANAKVDAHHDDIGFRVARTLDR